MEELEWKK